MGAVATFPGMLRALTYFDSTYIIQAIHAGLTKIASYGLYWRKDETNSQVDCADRWYL